MEAREGELVKHTYRGVDMILEHGTSVHKERHKNMNTVVVVGGFQFSQS